MSDDTHWLNTRAWLRRAGGALTAAALVLAGCSSGSTTTGKGTPSSPAPSSLTPATSSPAGSSGSIASSGGGCGDIANTVKQHVIRREILKVQVIGGCTEVSISTSLDKSGVTTALEICEKAAEVAYSGEISSVSVDGADNHELAIGLKSAACIGSP